MAPRLIHNRSGPVGSETRCQETGADHGRAREDFGRNCRLTGAGFREDSLTAPERRTQFELGWSKLVKMENNVFLYL
jgi:hypothetical protein